MKPAISILIRTFNSAGTLPSVLDRLELQPEDEIIVVDSGSTDATLAIAEKHRARILVAEPPFNYSKSLNIGFRAAKNPWVLVLSSHCIPVSSRFLTGWRKSAGDFPHNVAVAYGARLLAAGEKSPVDSKPSYCLNRVEWEEHKPIFAGNSNAIYRLDGWRRHEFNEKMPTGEDMEWLLWALRNGHVIAHVPDAIVLYRNRGSLRYMYGKGFTEAMVERKLLGLEPPSLLRLGIGIGSLVKKLFSGQMPLDVFAKQCAHQYGAFWGSRRPQTTGEET